MIDLASSDVSGILPFAKLDTTMLTTSSYLYVKGHSSPFTTSITTPGLFMVYDTSQGFGVIQSTIKSNGTFLPLRIEASIVNIPTTTDATAINTGAFQIAGGASIAKKLYVGTELTVGTNINLSSSASSSLYWGASTALIGRAATNTHFCSNSLAGDIVLRSNGSGTSTGNIRFATGGLASSLDILQNGNVNVANSLTVGNSLTVNGVNLKLPVATTVFSDSSYSSDLVNFTTTRGTQVWTGCISPFATTTQQNITFAIKIDNILVKSF
ncbi:hypothetical protein DFS34DRAFT_625230 [Phlyctochytrium arcticum]|nr:hypothetical protein DFS34DRAFT_625230 [Phlyctochytrium arcticum]